MRRRLVSLVVGVFLAAVPIAVRGDALVLGLADLARIRAVIESQLEAFLKDDGPGAFAAASPGIRSMVGDAERFMAMVRQAYPPVYRPREVEFRDVVEFQGRPTQRVLLVGPDGTVVVAYYMMALQPDGAWLIDGCVLMGADQTTI